MTIPQLAFTIRQACKAAGIGRTRLFQEIAAGRLRAHKSGTRTLVLVQDLNDYLENLPLARASACLKASG